MIPASTYKPRRTGMRTVLNTVLLTTGVLLFQQVAHGAVQCRPNYHDGKVHVICSETGQARYTCNYELPITYDKATATITGKVEVPRGAKDVRALSLAQYKGKRITGIGNLTTNCASKPVVTP
jgi:hypothetical protein